MKNFIINFIPLIIFVIGMYIVFEIFYNGINILRRFSKMFNLQFTYQNILLSCLLLLSIIINGSFIFIIYFNNDNFIYFKLMNADLNYILIQLGYLFIGIAIVLIPFFICNKILQSLNKFKTEHLVLIYYFHLIYTSIALTLTSWLIYYFLIGPHGDICQLIFGFKFISPWW